MLQVASMQGCCHPDNEKCTFAKTVKLDLHAQTSEMMRHDSAMQQGSPRCPDGLHVPARALSG